MIWNPSGTHLVGSSSKLAILCFTSASPCNVAEVIGDGIGDLEESVGIAEFGEGLFRPLSLEDEEATLADLGEELESMSEAAVITLLGTQTFPTVVGFRVQPFSLCPSR